MLPTQEIQSLRSFPETHTSHLSFNVMPERGVREEMHVREYRVGERYAAALFDRTYESSMRNSPSHLIFISVLVHTQKLAYLALCEEFGIPYEPEKAELFKLWPTKIDIQIPELLEEEKDLVQELWITDIKQFGEKTYRVKLETRVDSLRIRVTVPTFIL